MRTLHTHYDNLKVARNAPANVIRAAYKVLSQQYHPDRNPGSPEASRIMTVINMAYAVLSDPTRRNEYDQFLGREDEELFEAELRYRQQASA
jgi:DnaJ-class molecular chaperone